MGGKKTTINNTTQQQSQTNKNAPPEWTQGGLNAVGRQLLNGIYEIERTPDYTGEFVAQPNAGMTQGVIDAYSGAAQNSGNAGNWLQDLAKTTAGGGYALPTLTPMVTPEMASWAPTAWGGGTNGEARLNSAMTAAIAPVMRQLTDQILPGIRSSAIDSGAYSGDRAMQVLPTEAIAQAGGRASEITQGLAYEGFQAEQNRDLQAWQAFQNAQANAAQMENEFNLSKAGMANDYGLGSYNAITQALSRASNDNLARSSTSADLMRQGLQFQTAEGDLINQAIAAQLGLDQAGIDNAMAKDAYATQAPFKGLDIASNLLAQLSGNWGTQTADMSGSSYSKTTEKTSGLGPIVQGLAGIASAAGGLGLFGPIGTAASALKSAVPAASSIFGGNAYAGMKG